jgi:DNA-binding NarL/FixJ family response regulator
MYELGVYAYLTKNANHEDLIHAILKVQAGEKVFKESVYTKFLKATSKKSNSSKFKLTDREVQILKLIVKGQTNLQIAAELYLSPLTIKTHRQNLLCKLQVSNTAQLIAKADLSGLLKLNEK